MLVGKKPDYSISGIEKKVSDIETTVFFFFFFFFFFFGLHPQYMEVPRLGVEFEL